MFVDGSFFDVFSSALARGFTGGVIGGSIVLVFLIALVTVGSQAVKAALTNPAESLR